jgi:hypothetical protein
VDAVVAAQVPRMGNLLDTLGDSFETVIRSAEGNTLEEVIPNIPLDSRCTSQVG